MKSHPPPLTVSIADVVTCVSPSGEGPNIALCERESRFVVEQAAPDLTVTVTIAEPPEYSQESLLFDAGAAWQLHSDDEGTAIVVGITGSERVVRFNPERSRAEVICSPRMVREIDGLPAVDAIGHPVLQLSTYWKLIDTGGVGIHANGVVFDGGGYLFSGWSGAGKSTIGELWLAKGATILNDDRIGIRALDDGSVRIYGTPWNGTEEYAKPGDVPLKGIYFIEHAAENRLTPLQGVQGIAQLLAFTFFPMFDADMSERGAETARQIVERVPCYRLGFVPDPSVIDLVLATQR